MKGNFSVGFLIGFLSGELGDAFNHGGDFLYGLLKQAVQGGGIDALFQIVLNRFLIPDSFLGLSMEKAAVLVNANAVKQSVMGTRCKGQQLCGTPAVLPNRLYLSGLQNMRRVHINHHPATPLF